MATEATPERSLGIARRERSPDFGGLIQARRIPTAHLA